MVMIHLIHNEMNINISTIKKYLVIFFSSLLIMLPSCSLEEDVYSIYTTDTFFKNDAQVLASISGIYRGFSGNVNGMSLLLMYDFTGNQYFIPSRSNGWWYDPDQELVRHTWNALSFFPGFGWGSFFSTVGQTNALLASLDASGLQGLENIKAEARTLRAFAYFYLMDFYGNVPIFTAPKVDQANLPEQNTRAEVFDFVVSELKEAANDLPSQKDVGSEYYGRLTKEAAYSILAMTYLNAEVFTGTQHWDDVITYTDLIINSGAYQLLPDYFDNFVYNNEGNKEAIFSAVFTPNIIGGPGNIFLLKTLPSISGGLFGLPYAPENGLVARSEVRDLFEDQDIRKKIFVPFGPMIHPEQACR